MNTGKTSRVYGVPPTIGKEESSVHCELCGAEVHFELDNPHEQKCPQCNATLVPWLSGGEHGIHTSEEV